MSLVVKERESSFFVVNAEHRKINEKFRSSIPHGNFIFFYARGKTINISLQLRVNAEVSYILSFAFFTFPISYLFLHYSTSTSFPFSKGYCGVLSIQLWLRNDKILLHFASCLHCVPFSLLVAEREEDGKFA